MAMATRRTATVQATTRRAQASGSASAAAVSTGVALAAVSASASVSDASDRQPVVTTRAAHIVVGGVVSRFMTHWLDAGSNRRHAPALRAQADNLRDVSTQRKYAATQPWSARSSR